jgi:signal transduction histidine kinase
VSQLKILVVEDEFIVAYDIQSQLADLGHLCVGQATTGDQAIALAGSVQPDLVLMDIQLAGAMDGIVAAQAIRDQFFIPVVFLTAFSADSIIARAKRTAPYGYLLKPFTERELHTVIEMARYKHQAEVALHANARQLRALSHRVLQVQEAERRRIALELHDEIGQSLTAIKINLESHHRFQDKTPESLNAENLAMVVATLEQVRRLARALRPSMLDELGLVPSLRSMAQNVAVRSGFAVGFEAFEGETSERLYPDVEIACFRIAQEALTNIARHAQARQVDIEFTYDGPFVVLQIKDDGCGFDPLVARGGAADGESLGVLGMHERALLVGGQLEIQSQPGHGCTVRMCCPWRLPEVQP